MTFATPLCRVPLYLTALISGNLALDSALASHAVMRNVGAASTGANDMVHRDGSTTTNSVRMTSQAKSEQRPARHGRPSNRSSLARISAVNQAAAFKPDNAAFRRAKEVLPYTEGAIYDLHAAPERITDIQLEPGEVLASVASGDTARWIIGDTSSGSGDGKRVHILVKPFAADLFTNLLITTDRRSYHLNLKSNAHVATAAMSWTYPKDALLAFTTINSVSSPTSMRTRLEPELLNFNYIISGDKPRWRPIRAFDDGQKTYIEFPKHIETVEAPPLFLINGKNTELVNYRMQGRFYIVDRLFTQAELRLGIKRAIAVGIHRTDDGSQGASKRAARP
jgi:P-type conjugative transfer protein TrbG